MQAPIRQGPTTAAERPHWQPTSVGAQLAAEMAERRQEVCFGQLEIGIEIWEKGTYGAGWLARKVLCGDQAEHSCDGKDGELHLVVMDCTVRERLIEPNRFRV